MNSSSWKKHLSIAAGTIGERRKLERVFQCYCLLIFVIALKVIETIGMRFDYFEMR